MIMHTDKHIPQVYRKERDMQVFTRLLDIILTANKYDIDNLGDVYNAMKCQEVFLPLLGKTLNYNYNYEDTVTANRRTISSFTIMEQNRGSKKGLLMATALSLTSIDVSENNNELIISDEQYAEALKDIDIIFDPEEATITITYPNIYTLVRYLLDYVRPVGVSLELQSITSKNINSDVMLLYAQTDTKTKQYNPEKDTKLNASFVNFSGVADNQWIDLIGNGSTDIDFNT